MNSPIPTARSSPIPHRQTSFRCTPCESKTPSKERGLACDGVRRGEDWKWKACPAACSSRSVVIRSRPAARQAGRAPARKATAARTAREGPGPRIRRGDAEQEGGEQAGGGEGRTPKNPGAATPTISNGDRSSEMERPTASGAPPNSRCQKTVAEDGDGRAAADVVGRPEQAPDGRRHAEDVKKSPLTQSPRHPPRFAAARRGRTVLAGGEGAGEGALAVADRFPQRVGEDSPSSSRRTCTSSSGRRPAASAGGRRRSG